MAQLNRMSVAQLQDMQSATEAKIATIDARKTGRDADVDAAFAKAKAELQGKVDEISAEIARR